MDPGIGIERLQAIHEEGSRRRGPDTNAPFACDNHLVKCGKPMPDRGFAARHTVNRYQLMFVRERSDTPVKR